MVCNYKGERSAVFKAIAFPALRRMTPVIAVDHDGARFFVGTEDHLGLNLFGYRQFDDQYFAAALRLIARHQPPREGGRTLLEVGANIGTTTVPALRRHGFDRVLAVEPAPNNLFLLRQNVYANGLTDRVIIVPAAASDENGVVEMEISPHNSADHRVRVETARPGELGEENWGTTTVEAKTIDRLLHEYGVNTGDIGMVWMDVQGFEAHALAGATQILSSSVPVVMEYWPYGLRRAGGLERLWRIVEDNYRSFIDIREAEDTGDDRLRPVEALRHLDLGPGLGFTDILVLK